VGSDEEEVRYFYVIATELNRTLRCGFLGRLRLEPHFHDLSRS